MTQGTSNRSNKRSPRAGRYKPTLVTTPDTEAGDEQQDAVQEAEETTPVEETPTEVAPPTTGRRLPRFFSTVGKSEKEQEVSEETVVQARLARATRGRAAKAETTATADDKEEAVEQERKAATPARTASTSRTPARPPSPFKMKYIIGMVVYLLGAQLIGSLEVNLFNTYHIDSTLAQFPIFGFNIVVKTSTLVFLLILVLLLVLLAKLDLIPRSFSALTGAPPQKRGSTTSRRNNNDTVARTPQPTMRQGVSGADDDLYQQYRYNQRRKK